MNFSRISAKTHELLASVLFLHGISAALVVACIIAVACAPAIECVPDVASISAAACVPLVPDVLTVAGFPAFVGVPGVVVFSEVAGYRTVIFFCYRTIGLLNTGLANSRYYRTIGYRIKATIYRTIGYRTHKKLAVAHL